MTGRPFAFDLGNRFIKAYDGNQAWSMASVHVGILSNSPPLDENSADIRYQSGSRTDLIKKRWIVGTSARDSDRCKNTVMLSNKVEVALGLFLAIVRPPGFHKQIVLDPVYASLPNPHQDGASLKEKLLGTHHFSRNDISLELHVNRVITHAEGWGGYQYALREGVIQTGQINGVLDLGGGTAIASLYSASGQEIVEARTVFRKGGSVSLALNIANEQEMRVVARGQPKADMIMDAIASGTYTYGTTGYSFKHLFDRWREVWLKSLLEETTAHWDAWLDRISKIVLIGGAAPLAQSLVTKSTNDWLVVCPNSQYANVMGLMAAESKLLSLRGA